MTCDVIVLGGGAAGLFCAIHAGRRGKKVLVLERAASVGKKILISGGGRCNFTNVHTRPDHFLSNNPHFAKSALARFTPADFIALVEKHRIRYHEKKLGQLFCDGSSREIVTMLETECRGVAVQILTNCSVTSLQRGFTVETSLGTFEAPALVVATGGLSVPKMGATCFGYDIARQFGLNILPCRPALVPLVFAEPERRFCELAGVSMEAIVSCGGQRFQEKILFTHRGLSGPAILQISSYWSPGQPIEIEMCGHPPRRFAAIGPSAEPWRLTPAGTEGYAKAEVTAGGINTSELSSKTLEARKVPGLYFIGEVVDVTGHLGGFNFQWAWSSAHACATAQ